MQTDAQACKRDRTLQNNMEDKRNAGPDGGTLKSVKSLLTCLGPEDQGLLLKRPPAFAAFPPFLVAAIPPWIAAMSIPAMLHHQSRD
jgi:hypothetical protein